MKIMYSLPHPGDRLDSERAGHIVRANAILHELENLGNEVVRIEAATEQKTRVAVTAYRRVFKKLLPSPIALRLRDVGRIAHGRRYANRLIEAIRQHRPDLILETHVASNLAGKLASETTGLPLVIDDIAPIWEEEQQYGVGLKKSARGIYRQVTDQAKLLIAVNETIKRHLQKEGLPEEKIAVVENGIDGHLFYPGVDGRELRTRHGILGDEVVIVFVGSFQPYHRVDLLLHAFARVDTSKPIRLLLVGEGKYTPEARLVADNLDVLDRTIFTGRVPYDRVAAYAAAGDICIMPATNEYGNPMKVYEYMALGKAVLAPDQQTITDIATHNLNAYLFERENVEAISKAMQRLVDDTALRYRLGRQAGKLAAEHTWQKRAERMIWSIEQAGICA